MTHHQTLVNSYVQILINKYKLVCLLYIKFTKNVGNCLYLIISLSKLRPPDKLKLKGLFISYLKTKCNIATISPASTDGEAVVN